MTKRGKKTSLVSYVTMQFQLVQVKIKRGLLRTSLMSSCSARKYRDQNTT